MLPRAATHVPPAVRPRRTALAHRMATLAGHLAGDRLARRRRRNAGGARAERPPRRQPDGTPDDTRPDVEHRTGPHGLRRRTRRRGAERGERERPERRDGEAAGDPQAHGGELAADPPHERAPFVGRVAWCGGGRQAPPKPRSRRRQALAKPRQNRVLLLSARRTFSAVSGDSVRHRILFVEDEPSIYEPLSRALTRAGYEPLPARTTTEAFEAARRARPGLVLLDLRLPDGDGRDVCVAL